MSRCGVAQQAFAKEDMEFGFIGERRVVIGETVRFISEWRPSYQADAPAWAAALVGKSPDLPPNVLAQELIKNNVPLDVQAQFQILPHVREGMRNDADQRVLFTRTGAIHHPVMVLVVSPETGTRSYYFDEDCVLPETMRLVRVSSQSLAPKMQ